jgi:hypothetical protein
MQTFEIEVDPQRQILRAHFRGVVSPAALAAGAQRSAELIAQMRPGFIVVADLSELERMDDLDCVPHITRLMDLYRAAGVARVVRVIPDPNKDIGFTLLSLTHYRGKVPFETVESVAEAERALAWAQA